MERRNPSPPTIRRSKRERTATNANHDLYRQAEKKFLDRREKGYAVPSDPYTDQPGTNIGVLSEELMLLNSNEILPSGGQATLAFGLLDGKKLIACTKGLKKEETERISNLMLAKLRSLVPNATLEIFSESTGGFHSEMSIVEHVLNKDGDRSKDNVRTLKNRLQVLCLGKGVCPDCAGYLNKHEIPQFSLQAGKMGMVEMHLEPGLPSSQGQWMHPRTGAMFNTRTNKPEGPVLHGWQKGERSVSLSDRPGENG